MAVSAPRMSFSAADPRAEGGLRDITIAADVIRIARRVGPVRMRLAVPVAAYDRLSVEPGENAGCAIWLRHRDPDLAVLLDWQADAASADAALLDWQAFFAVSSNRPDFPNARRYGSPLRRRRARFLTRRKPGETRRLTTVFAGEREIVCYE